MVLRDVIRLALAGDTMLGRGVAEAIERSPAEQLVSDGVAAVFAEADAVVLNLECCISDRGERWPDPQKPFFFRAPPAAIDLLKHLNVDCVTLANNHALDFGVDALLDTLELLAASDIAVVGAGRDVEAARKPARIDVDGFRLSVVGFTDHPHDFAAGPHRPGVAYADLPRGVPRWIGAAIAKEPADAILVTPHWGPNMRQEPVPHVRSCAPELLHAGATLVAGHSAHVFQGVTQRVFFDLGDFLDDYAVDDKLRNDLGLVFLVDLAREGARRLEAVPIALDYCFTRRASSEETRWIADRFRQACAALGTEANMEDGRLVVNWT